MSNIYIITGPSGAGKSTIANELLERRSNLRKVVTCTTRPKRDHETDGVSYHFLTRETFESLIQSGDMFEWDEHYDNLYGSRHSDVQKLVDEGNDVLFVVDIAGAKTIKDTTPDANILFIEPETEEQLLERLQKRDNGSTAGLENRKASIEKEMAFAQQADHRIVNKEGKIEETVAEIEALMNS